MKLLCIMYMNMKLVNASSSYSCCSTCSSGECSSSFFRTSQSPVHFLPVIIIVIVVVISVAVVVVVIIP